MLWLGNAVSVPIDCNFADFLKLMEVGEKKSVKFEQFGMGDVSSLLFLSLFIKIWKSNYVKYIRKTTNTSQDYFVFVQIFNRNLIIITLEHSVLSVGTLSWLSLDRRTLKPSLPECWELLCLSIHCQYSPLLLVCIPCFICCVYWSQCCFIRAPIWLHHFMQ